MAGNFYIGEVYRTTTTVRNSAGTVTDPDAITCTATVNGVVKVNAQAMTQSSTGIYYYEITLDTAGQWDISSSATSGNLIQIEHDQIVVNPAVPYALCTVQELKTYLGIAQTTTTYDTALLEVIDGATGLIEDYCHRKFANQAYALDQYDGDGGYYLLLDNYPVTALTRFSIGTRSAMYVTNVNSDSASAYVSVDRTNVTLVVVGGANAGTNTVALATYTTMTALVTQINTIGEGWTATIYASEFDNFPSADLLDQFGLYAKSSNAYLYMPEKRSYDFTIDEARGIIHSPWCLIKGHQNIIVDYTAGFRVIPEGLKTAAMGLASYMYHQGQSDPTMKSETLGDYQYTTGPNALSDNGSINPKSLLGQKLNLYRRHIVM